MKISGSRGETVRRRVLGALSRDIARRKKYLRKVAHAQPQVITRAVKALGSPLGAAEWLITPAYGLEGKAPLDVLSTHAGCEQVIVLLGRIERNVLS